MNSDVVLDILFASIVLIVNIINLKDISQKYRSVYICRCFYLYYILQIAVSIAIVLIDSRYTVPGCRIYPLKVCEVLVSISLLTTLIGIVVRIAMWLSSYSSKKDNNVSLINRINFVEQNYNIDTLSTVLLAIFTLSILFTLIPDYSYALRVITLSFDFLPLFIGIFFCEFSRSKRNWCIFLFSLNSLLNLVQGSRGLAIIPVVLLCIGYLIAISNKKHKFKKTLVIYMIIGFPLMSIFGKVQDFRENYGRGIEVTTENVKLMLAYLFEGGDSSGEENFVLLGLSRFLNIGDLAIITLTPEYVGHRGIDDMDEEMKFIYMLHGGEGRHEFREQRGSFNYGSGVLTKYGFSVNQNTSVGMGLLGDSYSRFGVFGVIIYFFLMTLLLTTIEVKLLRNKNNQLVALTFLLFMIYTSLYTLYGNSYFQLFKKFLYNGTLVYIILNFLCSKQSSCKSIIKNY